LDKVLFVVALADMLWYPAPGMPHPQINEVWRSGHAAAAKPVIVAEENVNRTRPGLAALHFGSLEMTRKIRKV
jgi:hypothetical protein